MIHPAFGPNVLAWIVQCLIIAAAAHLLLALLRIRLPAIRYGWWQCVLVICLILPAQPRQLPGALAPAPAAASKAASAAASDVASVPSPLEGAIGAVSAGVDWSLALLVCIAGGAVLRFAWLVAGILRLRRLRGAGEAASMSPAHTGLQELIETDADIRYVPVIGQPVTFGLRHPVVLLPKTLQDQPPSIQRAVLAHELWHVRRRDWVWILAEECVKSVLWFNPAIPFLVSRIRSSREEVVDELTILVTNSRRSYLEALLAYADEPPLFAAAPFARRRHLFQRMMLISREAVMSSRRIALSGAAMTAGIVLSGWYGVSAFPLTAVPALPASRPAVSTPEQQPPRDARPGQARPASSREIDLIKLVAADPAAANARKYYIELADLQLARGAVTDAESTIQQALAAFPQDARMLSQAAGFYVKQGNFERAMELLENSAATDPSNPQGHFIVATHYWERAQKDQRLTPVDKRTYVTRGIDATDRALALKPDYVEALTYKNILLRMLANMEADTTRQTQLIAEADILRNRAIELSKARQASGDTMKHQALDGMPPPPPPPPPPPDWRDKNPVQMASEDQSVDGQMPVRVGGHVRPPTKVKDVRPVYPPLAQSAQVSGVVIVEATIDGNGRVRSATVLRSIPLLDQAALDAVYQWEFMPTMLNGVATPVIMTVTVNFTLQ
jgi:TonB family protein